MRRMILKLFRRRRLHRDLEAELAFHREMGAVHGNPIGLGNAGLIREQALDLWRFTFIENLWRDLVYAARSLRRSPAFVLTALLSLALGIGANTAIFSVMDALMLRTLPVRNPERLVLLGDGHAVGVNGGFPENSPDIFSQPCFQEMRAKNTLFTDIAALESMAALVHARVAGAGMELEPVRVRLVSGNYFTMLGVTASAGRVLTEEDDRRPGGNPIAVMSRAYWERRFARDAGVVGRSLAFNGTVFTIVGVAAPEFFGTVVGESPDLWIPLSMQAQVQPELGDPRGMMTQSLWLMGRLKRGVSLSTALASTNIIYQGWLHQVAGSSPSPEQIRHMKRATVHLTPAANGLSGMRRRFSRPLEILMVLVGLVLLIACANIANLLLARAAGRRREMAVRMALGAPRKRLIAQLLSESLLLALMGGSLGVLLALYGERLLLAMVSTGAGPVPLEVGPSGRVLLFTFGLSLLTGVIFGIAPALRMTRVDTGPTLQEGKGMARSAAHGRLGQALVAGQVALALFLMIGAGLFVRTFENLDHANVGFDKDGVLLLHLDIDSTTAKGDALLHLMRRIEERVRSLPRVQAASFCELVFNEGHWMALVWPEGVAHTEANATSQRGSHVGVQYFDVLGMPVVLGRGFGRQDTEKSPPVAVVNETFTRKLFPDVSPLGRHFALEGGGDFEIIGVVRDAKYESIREKPRGMFYLYNGQTEAADGFSDLAVRTEGRPEGLIGDIRAAIHAEDSNLAISHVSTLREQVDGSLGEEMILAKLAGFFGLVALLLASVGLYGVIAYSVARRTNEIGVRMALGAQPVDLVSGVMRESIVLVLTGFAAGFPAALACGRLVSSQLYGVPAHDPVTFAVAAATLLLVGLIATFIPARRAALLDPVTALREE